MIEINSFIKSGVLLVAMGLLSGCVGMKAPYGSESVEPLSINLIPVTAELLVKMAQENADLSSPRLPPLSTAFNEYSYQIGPGDILQLSVPSIVSFNTAGAPSILGETGQGYIVYADGTIYLPYSGAVKVGGLTLQQAQEAVLRGLSTYLRSPQVVVAVKEFRSQRILITGQVEKPGYLPVTDVPMTLVGALSTTGGITERRGGFDPRPVGGQINQSVTPAEFPDLKNVILKRGGQRYLVDVSKILDSGDKALDPVLIDGDVVVLPGIQRVNVFVLGEVARPGLLEVNRTDTDLADALMSTGGINQLTANPSRVYVIRGDYKNPTVYQVDARRPDAMLLAQRFPLLPNDVVYVSEAGSTRWNRGLQQVLPTIQGLLSTAIVANTVDDLKSGN